MSNKERETKSSNKELSKKGGPIKNGPVVTLPEHLAERAPYNQADLRARNPSLHKGGVPMKSKAWDPKEGSNRATKVEMAGQFPSAVEHACLISVGKVLLSDLL